MHFPIYKIAMDNGVKGLLNLSQISREDDESSCRRYFLYGEALGLEPPGDGVQICIADSIPGPKLRGREPLAIIGWVGILQVSDVLLEGVLLHVTAFENQSNAPGFHRAWRCSLIIFCLRQWIHIVQKGNAHIGIERFCNTIRSYIGLGLS